MKIKLIVNIYVGMPIEINLKIVQPFVPTVDFYYLTIDSIQNPNLCTLINSFVICIMYYYLKY